MFRFAVAIVRYAIPEAGRTPDKLEVDGEAGETFQARYNNTMARVLVAGRAIMAIAAVMLQGVEG